MKLSTLKFKNLCKQLKKLMEIAQQKAQANKPVLTLVNNLGKTTIVVDAEFEEVKEDKK